MASTKDTFESHTFLANSFAAGVFRGTGVDADLATAAYCVKKIGSYTPGATKHGNFSPGVIAFDEHTAGANKIGDC